jgi:hypothetical protein
MVLYINITPVELSQVAHKVEIDVVQYSLNNFAVCSVIYYDNAGTKVDSELVMIDGDEFNNEWITDDDLVNIVLRKCSISRLS